MSDFEDYDEPINKLEMKFNKAAEHLQKMCNSLKANDLLQLYGLYKQSTMGKCTTSKPSLFSGQARAKWNAWNDLGELNTAEAMNGYIQKMTEIAPDWDKNDKSEKTQQWVSVSVCPPEKETMITDAEKTIFDYVKEQNLEVVRKRLLSVKMNDLDEEGMGLIHWATDRNAVKILEYLLEQNADVNLQDSEGQTALHYASSCGHLDCLKILIQFNANPGIKDKDGTTCVDVAFDESVREFLNNN